MESEHTLLIFFDPSIGKDTLMAAIEEYGATVIYEYRIVDAVAIRIPQGTFIGDAIEFFQNVDGVTFVKRDQMVHPDN